MTADQVDHFVAQLPSTLDPEVRAGVLEIAGYLKDPDIGEAVADMLRLAIQAKSWAAFLASVDLKTAGGEGSGNFGHEHGDNRKGIVGGSGPGSSVRRPGKVAGSGLGDPHNFAMDRLSFNALKIRWAQVNNDLLTQLDYPDSPEAQEKLNELKRIVKEMYRLDADPGGIEGIGFPGGARDIAIVGAGPGGLASAVMGGTDGLDTLVLDANLQPGGQSKFSSRIENFPGFPVGVSGNTLATQMAQQAERVGAESQFGVRVTSLTYDPVTRLKTLTLSDGRSVTARAVILAGGVEIKTMDFPGSDSPSVIYQDSQRLSKLGAGKSVVVVGGSNGAAQAALGAAQSASQVTVISRSPIAKGMSDYQVNALRTNTKIRVIEGDEVQSLFNNKLITTKGQSLDANAVGLFVGGGPNVKWLPSSIALKDGKIAVNTDLESSMPGVFAVGDTRHGSIGRIGGAVGDGQIAERNAYRFIHEMGRSR